MLSVDDIFKSDIGFGPGNKVDVEGWLVVSQHLSYLINSEEQEKNAILVIAPGIYEQFLEQLAVRCGSMVGFVGKAKISGKIAKSGMSLLPFAFYKIEKIDFREADGSAAVYAPEKSNEPDWFDL